MKVQSVSQPLLLILLTSQTQTFSNPQDYPPETLPDENGWYQLFNGQNLDGWTPSENKNACKVHNGKLILHGRRSHLFYTGPIQSASFKDFELEAILMTTPGANSGIYFHTRYQDRGWPSRGYEAQINNTHADFKKTGSLYAIRDINKSPVRDNQWFTYHIKVIDRTIEIKINGQTITKYTEPRNLNRPHRQLDEGTIALQSHDSNNKVLYKSVKIRPLTPAIIATSSR